MSHSAPPVKLSIVMPVMNEAELIKPVLERVRRLPGPKEIIIVDDGSTDGTTEILRREQNMPETTVIFHAFNQGKGASIRTGLSAVTGDIVIIQDADLEYDPAEIPRIVQPIAEGRVRVAYGSRFLGRMEGMQRLNLIANWIFIWTVRLLYGVKLTDEATAYKAFSAGLICRMPLQSKGFEFCSEVTGMALRLGEKIAETPITYQSRSYAEGKKIGWRDFLPKMWELVLWRFRRVKLLEQPVNANSAGGEDGGNLAR